MIQYQSEQSDFQCEDNYYERGQQEENKLIKEFKYQLVLEEEQFKIRKNKKPTIPTDKEIDNVMQALQERFSQETFPIIKYLYLNLIPQNLLKSKPLIPNQKASPEEIKEILYLNSPLSKIEANIKLIQTLNKYIGFKKVFPKSIFISPQFSSAQQEAHYTMKKYCAQSFVFRGHSLDHFREELVSNGYMQQVDTTKYHPTLQGVIIEAYKCLQQFILHQCHIKINLLVRNQIKHMSRRLFHCRQTFKKDQYTIFMNLIKIVYGLEDVTLDEYYTIKLYLITQKGLRLIMLKQINGERQRRRRVFNPTNEKPDIKKYNDAKSIIYQSAVKNKDSLQLKNVWSVKLQHQFAEYYKKVQHFMDIKRYFISKYPEYRHVFEGNQLKNRFNQIMRASMRKVREIVAKNAGLAINLVKMDDNTIKYIMKSSRALKARLMLVDVYLEDSRAYTNKIEAVAIELNQAIADRPYYKNWLYSSTNQTMTENSFTPTQQIPKIYAPLRSKDYLQRRQSKQRGRKSKLALHLYEQDDRKLKKLSSMKKSASQQQKDEQAEISDKEESSQQSESSILFNIADQPVKQVFDPQFYYQQD